MSTMYYTAPDNKPIGQIHSLGKDKGYHFTWTMFPLDFALFHHDDRILDRHAPFVVDEYGNYLLLYEFESIVRHATSQSFEEGLE